MTRVSRRGPWLPEEDFALIELVRMQGPNNWVRISQQLRNRSPKQCRERYHQNLKSTLNHDPISPQEGEMIEQLVEELGKRWAEIARRLGNRSDNAVKNWWNGSMNRRKRRAPQHNGDKHVDSRLDSVPTMHSMKPDRGVPSRSPADPNQHHGGDPLTHSLWSKQVSCLTQDTTTQTSTNRLRSSSDQNPYCHGAVHHPLPHPLYPQLSPHDQSCSLPKFSLESTRLPPLRLPWISSPTQNAECKTEQSSISPVMSDISKTPSSRPTPSVASDSHSSYSISPKTKRSPSWEGSYTADSNTTPFHQRSCLPSHDSHGQHDQIALPSIKTNPTLPAFPPKLDSIHIITTYAPMEHTERGPCNPYANSYFSQRERDSRMQLSSLVQ